MKLREIRAQLDMEEIIRECEREELARLREWETRIRRNTRKIRNFAIGVGAAAVLFGVGYLVRDFLYFLAQKDVVPAIVQESRPSQPQIDRQPADSGDRKNQDEWFDYWSKVTDGRIMASMGDFYAAFKDIKRMYERGAEEEKIKAFDLLRSLRDDFEKTREISSTRIFYQPHSIDSKIVQHYRCSIEKMVKETVLEIPEYWGVPIAQVASDPKGLRYLQTLFDTKDDGETIIQVLEFISSKNRADIKVWTPSFKHGIWLNRANSPHMAAGLYLGVDFRFGGYDVLDYGGRSRGVLVKPR